MTRREIDDSLARKSPSGARDPVGGGYFHLPPVAVLGGVLLIALFDRGAGASLRSGVCPDFRPGETHVPKPETIFLRSPNFGERSNVIPAIDSVVMHTTEVSLNGTLNIFRSSSNAVSAHFVVAPNGDIYEMVDTSDRAWHATYYNSRSIGIEMVGFASQPSTWNEQNLAALTDLLDWIVSAYPTIPLTHPSGDAYDFRGDRFDQPGLVAHGQVQPWNRSDPGPFFPWNDVIADVEAALAVPEPSAAMVACSGIVLLLTGRRGHRTGAPS